MAYRFETKINKTETCWLWQGCLSKSGYGKITYQKKDYRAHRLIYELYKGPIPDGMCVCHTCDVRNCVNPDHLWLGTHQENTQDREQKGRGNCGRGENQGHSKLTIEDVKQIRNLLQTSMEQKKIAELFNVAPSQICAIKYGQQWSHV